MLSLFRRKKIQAPVRSAPEGLRLYAIGDVHGRLDALELLLDAVRADAGDAASALVMLGDYVDRGPASRQVLDRLIRLRDEPGPEARFIRGNHDATMLNFVTEASVGPTWCGFGGAETLASYGVQAPLRSDDDAGWEAAREAFAAALPPEHLRLLQALEPWVEYGDYFFTHAGARPGVELADQEHHDLMWIRDEFLRGVAVFSKTVVHGHTPEADAFVSDRRIGVDTGAYATGRLTAVVLEGTGRRLIQALIAGGRTSVEHTDITRPAVERARA